MTSVLCTLKGTESPHMVGEPKNTEVILLLINFFSRKGFTMDNEQILKLVEAGFTADEIRKMSEQPPEPESRQIPTNEQGAPNTEHAGEVKKELDVINPNVMELTKTVKDLTATVKELQAANVNKAKIDKPSTTDTINETIKSFMDTL